MIFIKREYFFIIDWKYCYLLSENSRFNYFKEIKFCDFTILERQILRFRHLEKKIIFKS